MKITNVALDAMGGDNAPVEIIKGAIDAINEDNSIKVFLVGKEEVIKNEKNKYNSSNNRFKYYCVILKIFVSNYRN